MFSLGVSGEQGCVGLFRVIVPLLVWAPKELRGCAHHLCRVRSCLSTRVKLQCVSQCRAAPVWGCGAQVQVWPPTWISSAIFKYNFRYSWLTCVGAMLGASMAEALWEFVFRGQGGTILFVYILWYRVLYQCGYSG